MSCDHQLIAVHVSDYIEGNLAPLLQTRYAEILLQCAHCRDIHNQALAVYQLAHQWQEQPVPDWHRARHAVQLPRQNQSHWLSWGALAASLAAVCLVLFRVEVSTTNGLLISFGGSQTETRVQQLLTEELARYTATQDLLLGSRLEEFGQNQLDSSALQFAQWQEATRVEHRDELNFLLSGWQSQRYQDQQAVNEQITELASGQIEQNQYLNALMQTVVYPGGNGL